MIWRFLLVVVVSCVIVNGFPDLDPDGMRIAKLDANQEKEEYTDEENLGDDKVVEGDIVVDNNIRAIMSNVNKRETIANSFKHWIGGRVPYVFESSVSSRVRIAFQAAIDDFHRYTCIRFVPRTNFNTRDYIYVVSGRGCYSALGRIGGLQRLSLGPGCEHKGKAIHELMHALGFFHEQSRLDRDKYITIDWSNIRSDTRRNFMKYGHGEADTLGAPYDYGSIMHYPSKAFSINGQRTIITTQLGAYIGQRNGFSKIDLQQINKLYKCGGAVTTTTRPKPPTPTPTIRQKPTTRPPTRLPVVSCSDAFRYRLSCSGWVRNGLCSHAYLVRRKCKKSCGLCAKVSCKDNTHKCPEWRGYCSRGNSYMMRECKKTCGKC